MLRPSRSQSPPDTATPLMRLVNNPLLNQVFAVVAFLLAFLLLWALGIRGLGREGPWMNDFDWFWVGGRVWLSGQSNYDPDAYGSYYLEYLGIPAVTDVLPYPPAFAPITMVFAAFDLPQARWLWMVFLLCCILGTAWMAWLTTKSPLENCRASALRASHWLVPAIVIGMPTTATGLYFGQPSALLALLLMAGWYCVNRGRPWVAGVLLGIAAFKPQLVVLPLFWLLLDRQWKTILSAGFTAFAMSAYVMIQHGPIRSVFDWLEAMGRYDMGWANVLGSHRIQGVPSALASLGIPVPDVPVFLLLALGLTAGLHSFRHRILKDDVLGILMAIYLGFVFCRRHEFILLTPMFVAWWLHVGKRSLLWPAFLAIPFMLVVPERLMGLTGLPIMMFWPTVVVILSGFALLAFSVRGSAAAKCRPLC